MLLVVDVEINFISSLVNNIREMKVIKTIKL